MDASSISKLRKEYYESMEDLQTWITKAEHILSSTQPNSDEGLHFFGRELAVRFLIQYFLINREYYHRLHLINHFFSEFTRRSFRKRRNTQEHHQIGAKSNSRSQ